MLHYFNSQTSSLDQGGHVIKAVDVDNLEERVLRERRTARCRLTRLVRRAVPQEAPGDPVPRTAGRMVAQLEHAPGTWGQRA